MSVMQAGAATQACPFWRWAGGRPARAAGRRYLASPQVAGVLARLSFSSWIDGRGRGTLRSG